MSSSITFQVLISVSFQCKKSWKFSATPTLLYLTKVVETIKMWAAMAAVLTSWNFEGRFIVHLHVSLSLILRRYVCACRCCVVWQWQCFGPLLTYFRVPSNGTMTQARAWIRATRSLRVSNHDHSNGWRCWSC